MRWPRRGFENNRGDPPPPRPQTQSLGIVVRAASTTGHRSTNQDRNLAAGGLVAVADGVGGSVRGDVAAQVALGRLAIESALIGQHVDPTRAVTALVRSAHEQVVHASETLGAAVSASTLTLVRATKVRHHQPDRDPTSQGSLNGAPSSEDELLLTFAWVGDSPAYLVRSGAVEQLTSPHTSAPDGRAGGTHLLDRALGAGDATPSLVARWAGPGARALLATDGILDIPRDRLEATLLDSCADTAACLAALVELALRYDVRDNTTVAVVDVVRTGRAALTDLP